MKCMHQVMVPKKNDLTLCIVIDVTRVSVGHRQFRGSIHKDKRRENRGRVKQQLRSSY